VRFDADRLAVCRPALVEAERPPLLLAERLPPAALFVALPPPPAELLDRPVLREPRPFDDIATALSGFDRPRSL
jgi:hypothetical protein